MRWKSLTTTDEWEPNVDRAIIDAVIVATTLFIVGWGELIMTDVTEIVALLAMIVLAAVRALREYFEYRTAQIED